MFKMKKGGALVIASLVLSVALTIQCFAITLDNEKPLEDTGGYVTVQVYAPGKSADDLSGLSKGSYTDAIVYQQQTTVDDEGNYEFEFGLDGYPSGKYLASISEPQTVIKRDIIYIDAEENNTAIGLLNGAVSQDEFLGILKENTDELGLHIPLFAEYEDAAAGYAYDYVKVKNNPLSENDSVNTMSLLSRAALASALNSGDELGNILSYDDYVFFSGTAIGEWYQKSFVTDDVAEDMTERMKGKSISEESFDDVLTEAFVLAVVKNPDGSANVKDVLNAYHSEIGIKQNGKNSTYVSLANEDYSSFEELKEAFEEFEKNGSGGGGGGGGGSSSGGSGGSQASVSTEIISKEPAKDIPLDIFVDLDGHKWAKEAIVSLAERNIVNGKGDGCFAPGDSVTREEFVKMLVETFFAEETGEAITFADADPQMWYYPYLCVASKLGIVNGIDANRFGVGQNITRQDMAVMVYRAALKSDPSYFVSLSRGDAFEDEGEIADYAKEVVYILRANEVISGVGNNKFAPLGSATRAEAAMLLYNLLS